MMLNKTTGAKFPSFDTISPIYSKMVEIEDQIPACLLNLYTLPKELYADSFRCGVDGCLCRTTRNRCRVEGCAPAISEIPIAAL